MASIFSNLTPWRRRLLEKLIVQPFNIPPTSYGTRRCIPLSTRGSHWSFYLNHRNTGHVLPPHFFKISFNIISPFTFRSFVWSPFLSFGTKTFMHFHARHMPRPSRPPPDNHPINSRLGVQIIRRLKTKFSSFSFYFLSVRSKCFLQHPVLEEPHVNVKASKIPSCLSAFVISFKSLRCSFCTLCVSLLVIFHSNLWSSENKFWWKNKFIHNIFQAQYFLRNEVI